ncbi:glycerol channel [Thoreauomyces humboldtii]|nr:glycerol channel [Thoreauomyces humboldtii]
MAAPTHTIEMQDSKDTILSINDGDELNERIVDQKGERRTEHPHRHRGNFAQRLQTRWREELAEYIGTMVMILLGNGVCAEVALNAGGNGTYLSISIGWGLAVLFGVYIAGGISGAHLNPAVTVSSAVHNGFPWKRVPFYIASQLLGAFTGAAIVFANYHSGIDNFDGGNRQTTGDFATAGIFATYPKPYLTRTGQFFSEFIGTAVLIIGLSAIGCKKNADAPRGYAPVAVALLVMAIGISLGSNTGYAINPARDLAPRFMTMLAGYGTEPFTAAGHYFWIPVVGPLVGGVFGGYVWRAFAEYNSVDEIATVNV